MKQITLTITAVLLLVLLAACTSGGDNRQGIQQITGTQGIFMYFAPNIPPAKVYDDQGVLDVIVELQNRGAYELGNPGDKLYLSGYDTSIIQIPITGQDIPDMAPVTLYSKSAIGGGATLTFTGPIRPLQNKNVPLPLPLQATACYTYKTDAGASVCIDPDPFSPGTTQKACTPRSVGTGSQGAPIAVTNVDVEAMPKKTRFTITISNVGGGDVFKPGQEYLSKCDPYSPSKLQYTDLDYIKVDGITVGNNQNILSDCTPINNGYIRLTNGKATLTCTYNMIPFSTAVTTQLNTHLSYSYRQTTTQNIILYPSTT